MASAGVVIPLFAVLAASVAAITAFHLRSRPRGAAAAFPSFQHLRGLAPRRQPAWPLEEPARWALRVLALILSAAALCLARREDRRPIAILVEPGLPAWHDAASFVQAAPGPAVALTYDGEKPLVAASPKAAESGERARRTLATCSAAFETCLTRAAAGLGADTIVQSSFREPGATFAELGAFRFVRSPPVRTAERQQTEETRKPGSTRVLLRGTSVAARIWAAALTVAGDGMGAGETEIAVADGLEDSNGSQFVLVPVAAAGALARAEKVGTAPLPEDAALAAGAEALALDSSLRLNDGASQRALVAPVLALRGKTLLAAATEEDLGSWAHSPVLIALARVVLFASGRGLRVTRAAPGSRRWLSLPTRETAPVGIEDVAPGRYEREDGRVELSVARDARQGAPLSDATLETLGGHPLATLPSPPSSSRWPVGLLAAAIALRLADAPRRRRVASTLFTLSAAALVLLALDPSFLDHLAVRTAPLSTGRLSLPDSVADAACGLPGSARPCAITARAAFADEAAGANAVVFPPGRPRVEILSWELPTEIRAGEAGLLRATLRVRRAAGREVALTARLTSGRADRVSRKASSDSETLTLSVPVLAATEGISFALVSATVGEDGDSVVAAIVTRSREPRRLVLAASPAWEARAAGEALATRGAVERLTRLGATAVLARGAPPEEPLDRLSGDLLRFDLVVLCGFTAEELAGTREAALARYVERGGAVLFAGGLPRLPSLPLPQTPAQAAGDSGLPSRVTGTFGERTLSFQGFSPWKTTLPSAGVVLARLDGAPWIVGRGFGKGRIAAFTAPDVWRARGSGAGYETLLNGIVAWLEAGRAGDPILLTPDLRSLTAEGTATLLPAESVSGLPVDPVDPLSLLPPGPARERVLAQRSGLPFLESDSPAELSSILARVPAEKPLPRRVSARDQNFIWLGLCALLVAEVFVRRRAP